MCIRDRSVTGRHTAGEGAAVRQFSHTVFHNSIEAGVFIAQDIVAVRHAGTAHGIGHQTNPILSLIHI